MSDWTMFFGLFFSFLLLFCFCACDSNGPLGTEIEETCDRGLTCVVCEAVLSII